MGYRATFIEIKNVEELYRLFWMEAAADDLADVVCFYGITGAFQFEKKLFVGMESDGSGCMAPLNDLGFRNRKLYYFDDLYYSTGSMKVVNGRHGSRIKNAKYLTMDQLLKKLDRKGAK